MVYALDFRVPFDPAVDTQETLTEKIIYSLFVANRLKAHKPAICFICGDSGEGKSYSAIILQYILCKTQGIDIRQYFNIINAYSPLEYPTKLNSILHDKTLKQVNILSVHEARELVGAKNWYTFLTRAVADVNAMSRGIKRLCIMIISQFIRDISTDIRYSLNFYIKVQRTPHSNAKLFINVLWKDDRDLEKPKLRKRRIKGWLIYPNGKKRLFIPKYLEVGTPPQDLIKIFEEQDRAAKIKFIKNKLDKLIKQMELEIGLENTRVTTLVNWLVKPENALTLNTIGKRIRKKWRLSAETKQMYGLTDVEVESIEDLLPKRMRELKLIQDDDSDGIAEAETESEKNIEEA